MSTTTETKPQGQEKEAAALPDPETAFGTIFDGVHADVFFGRLAAHGITPQTEKEAQDLLLLAGRLRVAEEEKQANDSRYGGYLSALNGVTGNAEEHSHFEREQAIKEAAAIYAQNPAIYNSVLSLKAHEAALAASEQPADQAA